MNISVITINYNSSDYTIKLIDSIKKFTRPELNYEVIIVDNASKEEEKEKLRVLSKDESIKLIYNRKNTGFAAGNMLGVQYSHADYYCFLNNDLELQNDILSIFYKHAQEYREYALLTAQLHLSDSSKTTSFKKFPTLANKVFGNGLVRLFQKNDFPSNKSNLTQPTDVGVVSGSCMFFNAKVFDKIGGFDTLFFLYCEEEDISKRVWDEGYRVRVLPEAKAVHYEGGSSEKSLAMEKEYYISYFILIDKHFGYFSAILLKLLTSFKLFRRSFRSSHYLKLFLFALRSAPIKESLRYKQSIR